MKSIILFALFLSNQVGAFTFVSSSCRQGILQSPFILEHASSSSSLISPQRPQQQIQHGLLIHNDDNVAVDLRRQQRRQQRRQLGVLFMGRAAAVRAATKAKTDSAKAKTNGLFGKKIVMAVKQGGGPDPVANRMLADVIKQARINNVPVDNINRAIKRASESNVGDFSESTFEAYGFGGASFVINVLTDNNNRATSDIKSCVGKRQGKIAEQGSVLFLYDRRGKIEVAAELDEESLTEAAIEAGCNDLDLVPGDVEGTSVVYTDPKEAALMVDAIKSLGHENMKMSLTWVSKAPVECTDTEFERNMQIIDALEELDDVDSVQHNMVN